MKIQRTDTPRTLKLCWAQPGDLVELEGKIVMVCIDRKTPVRQPKPTQKAMASCGLFAERSDLYLVDVASGELMRMPHLSSRVRFLSDARLILDDSPSCKQETGR
jgi:hypothetical protein